MRSGLEEPGEHPALLCHLARYEARTGRRDEATAWLRARSSCAPRCASARPRMPISRRSWRRHEGLAVGAPPGHPRPRRRPRLVPARPPPLRHPGLRRRRLWAREAGDRVIDEHTEEDGGDEELYLVLSGHATFTVDREEIDAPQGTLPFVEPSATRTAFAEEPGTTVLAIGAKPGEAYLASGWELGMPAYPHYQAKEYGRAVETIAQLAEQFPRYPGLLYNLACCESLAGRRDDAVEHLRRAIEIDERFRRYARKDPDLDPIRNDPELAALLAEQVAPLRDAAHTSPAASRGRPPGVRPRDMAQGARGERRPRSRRRPSRRARGARRLAAVRFGLVPGHVPGTRPVRTADNLSSYRQSTEATATGSAIPFRLTSRGAETG